MSPAEIVQTVIGALSLIATVAVSFLIYWLQHRHELELEKAEQKKQDEILEQKAHEFLIKNEAEREYLPWCVIATNLHRHEKHKRKIYTNFCACSDKLQKKILELAEFTLTPLEGTSWVDDSFKMLEECIKQFKLGQQPFLYDGAKYFHRAFDYYSNEQFSENRADDFKTIYRIPLRSAVQAFAKGDINISRYIEQYFDFIISRDKDNVEWDDPTPPIDYAWNIQGLGYIDEKVLCCWVMEIVHNIVVNIHNRFFDCYFESEIRNNSTGAYAETYEDYYYSTLFWMYFTFRKAIEDTKDGDTIKRKKARARRMEKYKTKKEKPKKIKTKKEKPKEEKNKKKLQKGVDKS